MPIKLRHDIKSVGSQSDKRKPATYYDQHKSARFPQGRPWWCYNELPSDPQYLAGPVSDLYPGEVGNWDNSWEAPWYPDAKYLRPNPETGKLQIVYGGMISDYKGATEKYYQACAVIAYDKGWEAPDFNGKVSPMLRAILGPPPQSPKIPEAAQAGDPWILGFTPERNELLARVLQATTYGGSGIELPEPLVKAADVLTMTPEQLNVVIAEAVAKAMVAQDAATSNLAKARAAKAAKKAQAQATAA